MTTTEVIDVLVDDFNWRQEGRCDKTTYAERRDDKLVVKDDEGRVFVFKLDKQASVLDGESEETTDKRGIQLKLF